MTPADRTLQPPRRPAPPRTARAEPIAEPALLACCVHACVRVRTHALRVVSLDLWKFWRAGWPPRVAHNAATVAVVGGHFNRWQPAAGGGRPAANLAAARAAGDVGGAVHERGAERADAVGAGVGRAEPGHSGLPRHVAVLTIVCCCMPTLQRAGGREGP